MRRLKNRCLVPPGGDFRFTHETGHTTRAPTYDDWVSESKTHLRGMGLPVPADLKIIMEDQLCGVIPPEWCDREAGDISSWIDTNFGWNDFVEGMKVFSTWGLAGAPMVSQGEANRRAGICTQCPANVGITGCQTCRRIASYITGSVAKKRTPYDDSLKACAVCHCALKALVWFDTDITARQESADRQAVRPSFCWMKVGGENFK